MLINTYLLFEVYFPICLRRKVTFFFLTLHSERVLKILKTRIADDFAIRV